MLLLGIDIASAAPDDAGGAGVYGLPAGVEGTAEAFERLRAVLGEE